MKTIKKIIGAVVGIFAAIAGIAFFFNSNKNKKQSELNNKIKNNDDAIEKIEEAVEVIEKKREAINDQITDAVTAVQELKEVKENLTVEVRDVVDAKANILNKTKRGRKPNNKKK